MQRVKAMNFDFFLIYISLYKNTNNSIVPVNMQGISIQCGHDLPQGNRRLKMMYARQQLKSQAVQNLGNRGFGMCFLFLCNI